MPIPAAAAIFAAGPVAGTVTVVVGSGSLITFPTQLALGSPSVCSRQRYRYWPAWSHR